MVDGFRGKSDAPYYPAAVADYPHVGDHAPLILPIPVDTEDALKSQRRMRVKNPGTEERVNKNQQLAERLRAKIPHRGQRAKHINPGKYYNATVMAITEAFQDECVARSGLLQRTPWGTSSLRIFAIQRWIIFRP